MKVVINTCYGGFSLSRKAVEFMVNSGSKLARFYLNRLSGKESCHCSELRADPYLISAVEELGDEANGGCAKLKVVDIPDYIDWYVSNYDGMESIHEKHEIWY
jgi:hypothetical protein